MVRGIIMDLSEISESRQKRTPNNRGLDSTLVWHIKELIKRKIGIKRGWKSKWLEAFRMNNLRLVKWITYDLG